MPIADATSIAAATGLSATLAAKAAVRAPNAERELRDLIGTTKYDEIEDEGSGDDYDALKDAESLLSAAIVLPTLNLRITEGGGIVMETGHEHTRAQYMTHREVKRYAKSLREQAHARCRPFLVETEGAFEGQYIHPFVN